MRPYRTLTAAALLLAATSAMAEPQFTAPAPIPHVQDAQFSDRDKTPYAMRYSDEAAQTLGVKDGKWEAFNTSSSNSLMPSLNAGADAGGAMIKLQWR